MFEVETGGIGVWETHHVSHSPHLPIHSDSFSYSNTSIDRLCHLLLDLLHRQTQHDGRFYELKIHCPESYPAAPPEVRFVSKINMNCVDSKTGKVTNKKLPCMRSWNRNMGIEQVLVALRQEMTSSENRKLKQPMEGSTF